MAGQDGLVRFDGVRFVHWRPKTGHTDLLGVVRSLCAARDAEHMADEPISPRALNVLSLMVAGERNKEIASELSVAEDTVKMHVRNILSKLQVNDYTEAVTIAFRRGIIYL